MKISISTILGEKATPLKYKLTGKPWIDGVALFDPINQRIVISLCRPYRHNHLFGALAALEDYDHEQGLPYPSVCGLTCGFTACGKFYDRKEAYKLTVSTGQLKDTHPEHPVLCSEDLW